MEASRVRTAALCLLQGASLRAAAAQAGYADGAACAADVQAGLHATPDALRRWEASGRYRIVYGAPFHLQQTLAYLGRDPGNLAERVEGQRYARHFPLGRGAVPVTLHLAADHCTVHARRPQSPGRALELHELLVRVLGLAQPLPAFYRAARHHPVMGELVRRFAGVRIPQLPSLWEALCWAVIGQQINLAFAYRLRNRLIALAHGVPAARVLSDMVRPDGVPSGRVPSGSRPSGSRPSDSRPSDSRPARLLPFPAPAAVLRLRAQDLTAVQFSRQKARYLLGLAEACHAGELRGLEQGARDWPAIEARLLAQTGLGPWSTAYAMMRGLGYLDGLPVGDTGLRTALQRSFRLRKPPTVAQQERLMEPFRPYRSLATYYLWKSLATVSAG